MIFDTINYILPTGSFQVKAVDSRVILNRMTRKSIEFEYKLVGHELRGIYKGIVGDLCYLWLGLHITENTLYSRCEADDCERIFVMSRSHEKWCSDQCRARASLHRRKKRKALAEMSTES